MVKGYSPLEGTQEDINRRLYRMIQKAESGDGAAIKALQDAIGDETTANTILKRLKDHDTEIGKASGTGAGGILKDIADLKAVVGDASTDDTLVKNVAAILAAIGDESTVGTILYRIKALEDA